MKEAVLVKYGVIETIVITMHEVLTAQVRPYECLLRSVRFHLNRKAMKVNRTNAIVPISFVPIHTAMKHFIDNQRLRLSRGLAPAIRSSGSSRNSTMHHYLER